MRDDGPVDWLSVVSANGEHGGEWAVDLIEQRADPGSVAVVRGGQFRGQDLAAVRIDRQMELPPSPARLAAVLLVQPLARPKHLQAGAVDHDVDRTLRFLQGRRDSQLDAAAGECGVIALLALTGSGTDNAKPSR